MSCFILQIEYIIVYNFARPSRVLQHSNQLDPLQPRNVPATTGANRVRDVHAAGVQLRERCLLRDGRRLLGGHRAHKQAELWIRHGQGRQRSPSGEPHGVVLPRRDSQVFATFIFALI